MHDLVVRTHSKKFKTSKSYVTTLYPWFPRCKSVSSRFERFKTHQIHVKLPFGTGLPVVRTDSKPLTHIEFMSNDYLALVYSL